MSQVATDLVEIYTLRAKLHKKLYQHHTANVAELMITDVRSSSPRAEITRDHPRSPEIARDHPARLLMRAWA